MEGMERKEYENLEWISAILGMIGQSWSYIGQALDGIPAQWTAELRAGRKHE